MAETYEKDGLIYCAKCNAPLQHKYELNGEQHIVRVKCNCSENQRVAEETEKSYIIKQERIKEAREAAFCDKRLLEYTFDKDDGANGKMSIASVNYVKHFDVFLQEGKGILFFGGVGVGKTFYAGCIANALIDAGYTVIFTNFIAIANEMFANKSKQEYIEKLSKCDLLILDDLASERDTEYMGELVQTIIDKRYMNRKPIIITTNLTSLELRKPKEIRQQRIYSRIYEMCLCLEIEGQDRRRVNLHNDYEKMKKLLEIA